MKIELKDKETISTELCNGIIVRVTNMPSINDGYVAVELPNHKTLIIGTPNSQNEAVKEGYDSEIYVSDHAHILLRGEHKNHIDLLVDTDEYDAGLEIKETESNWMEFRDNRREESKKNDVANIIKREM